VEVVAEILVQLSYFRQPTSLKILSERCKLSPSMVHRYLSSMIKLGFIYQGQKSGYYSLGRNAVSIGLAAIQQMDQVDDVMEELGALVKEVNCHVAITVWSKTGPTIIRWERSEDRLAVPMQLGQVLPVLHSASGRVFAAFLDASLTSELISRERVSYGDLQKPSDEELQSMLTEVRQNRCAVSKGEVESETTAISTPVVDWQDNPILVLTAVVSKHADDDRIFSVLDAMRRFSDQKSIRKPSYPFESPVLPGSGEKSSKHQNGATT
jgi:DNA-binding IclR family transcriptional regulator